MIERFKDPFLYKSSESGKPKPLLEIDIGKINSVVIKIFYRLIAKWISFKRSINGLLY